MGGTRTILVILIASILLFGCTGPGAGAGPSGGAGPGAGAGPAGGAGPAAGAETQQQQTQQQTQQQQGGPADYSGMAYTQLLGLGVPLQCDITTTSQGETVTARVYMKGESEIRTEVASTSAAGDCPKIISITKNDKMYMGCEGGSLFEGTSCAWLEFDVTPSGGEPSGAGAYEPPDYTNVPSTQISCVPWVYDASKFVPSGKTCTMDDLMHAYQYQ